MKYKFLIIVLFLLLFSDTILLLKLFRNKAILNSCNDTVLRAENSINYLKKEALTRNSFMFKFELNTFMSDQIYADTLLSLIGDQTKLFFLSGPGSCDACVDNAILDIIELSKRIGHENIIILCQYDNLLDLKILSRQVFPIKVINLRSANLPILDETREYLPPSFFLMDCDLEPKTFFIFSTLIPSLNEDYFNSIENYFNGFY